MFEIFSRIGFSLPKLNDTTFNKINRIFKFSCTKTFKSLLYWNISQFANPFRTSQRRNSFGNFIFCICVALDIRFKVALLHCTHSWKARGNINKISWSRECIWLCCKEQVAIPWNWRQKVRKCRWGGQKRYSTYTFFLDSVRVAMFS